MWFLYHFAFILQIKSPAEKKNHSEGQAKNLILISINAILIRPI